MGSSGKRKTTMAKLNRERKLLERRQEKQARKDARKRAAQDPDPPSDTLIRQRRISRAGPETSGRLWKQ